MLHVYKPIENDPIFELHEFAEHLVIDIWCNANEINCFNKINGKYQILINSYQWLKDSIVEIDNLCEGLTPFEQLKIEQAFKINNDIEGLCNGNVPVYLDQLPKVVEDKMKPLFVKFYEELLNRDKVKGDKLEYYVAIYKKNRFKFCPCCGYMAFDTGLLDRREAYDHYLPKSEYPFASVNFKNLVPLCYKCNSDRKKAKDPIENNRKAFYPYRKDPIKLDIEITLEGKFMKSLYENIINDIDEDDTEIPKIEDITVNIESEENEQVETWDDLFTIKDRFSERTGQFSFSHLSKMKRRYMEEKSNDPAWKFSQTLDKHIKDYENDKYIDEKYLKIPFMIAVKKNESLLKVYN